MNTSLILTMINIIICKVRKIPRYILRLNNLDVQENVYFVEFDKEYGNIDNCKKDQKQFKESMEKLEIQYQERRIFCSLFNGISISVEKERIHELVQISNIKAIWPIVAKKLPTYIKHEKGNATTPLENHKLTNVEELHELGLDGTGIKIGVIDTGIDYLHPALGGCFKSHGCRVQYGADLVGDVYDGSIKKPVPDTDPRDTCGGHGTHVAGIIGANDVKFKGVAPNVTLGAYRVFGCGPNAKVESDVIIEALELAYKDGMDIVNLSLGGGSSWGEYPDSVVAHRLVTKGMIVVAAAGNDGDKGLWEISSPSIGEGVISVASFDSETYVSRAFMISSLKFSRYDYTIGPKTIPFNVTDLPFVKLPSFNSEGCLSFNTNLTVNDTSNFNGKVVLVRRGSCNFLTKITNAQNAGASGLVVINNGPGVFTPIVKNGVITIPLVGVSSTIGTAIENQLEANRNITLSTPGFFVNSNGGKISSFSSWGPGPELELKPDVGAPGGLIYSTFPLPLGSYATLSGTSMATPYTAGVLALYLQAAKKYNVTTTPEKIRMALMNTCVPKIDKNSTMPVSVTRQGAGMINALGMIISASSLEPSNLVINSTYFNSSATYSYNFTIINKSDNQTIEYDLIDLPASSVSPYKNGSFSYTPQTSNKSSKVILSMDRLILLPKQRQVIKMIIIPPIGLNENDTWLFSGYVQVKTNQTSQISKNGDTTLHLPYLGVLGDYKNTSILSKDDKFPLIKLNRNGAEINNKFNSSISEMVTMQSNDTITLNVRVINPTRLLLIKVYDISDNNEIGYIHGGVNYYVGRNDNKNNMYFKFSWSGVCVKPANKTNLDVLVPFSLIEGRYKLAVNALKPFGDPDLIRFNYSLNFTSPVSDNNFDYWLSPEIVISRTNITDMKSL